MAEIVLKNLTKDYRSNEAYKTLRTNIEFSGSDKKVIVFTSCTPNEGKSTVTMGLAASLAEGGKRVLFVDADLRKFRCICDGHLSEDDQLQVRQSGKRPAGEGRLPDPRRGIE